MYPIRYKVVRLTTPRSDSRGRQCGHASRPAAPSQAGAQNSAVPGGLGLLAVAPDDLRGFLHQQAQHGPAQATRATQLYAVKALYAYAASEGFRLENPAHGLKLSVRGRIRTEVYTRPEADRILSWAGAQPGRRWMVGHPLLATFRYAGLRLSEIVSQRARSLPERGPTHTAAVLPSCSSIRCPPQTGNSGSYAPRSIPA